MFEKLTHTIESLIEEFDSISSDRKVLLDELSIYLKEKIFSTKNVCLVFICTHNSRRSHLAQIWAQAASYYHKIDNIQTFSGGTQKTSFNISAVLALKKAGFKIKTGSEGRNPKYKVRYAKKVEPLICFSKTYDNIKNPCLGFVAIMTCSDADDACPVIEGAEYRTSLAYEDPKIYDGTNKEESAYEERSLQIGLEMLYVFHQLARFNGK